MHPLRPPTSSAHTDLLGKVFRLERTGQFDEALNVLRTVWDDTTADPDTSGLDPMQAADTYLRCGAVIGFLAHSRQIPTGQESSKNLLTKARSLFAEINEPEKTAECENYLALSYWRNGEWNEAQSWVEEALSHDLAEDSDVRIYTHVIHNLVLLSQKRFLEVRANFAAIETLVAGCDDKFLAGSAYNNYALAEKNLGSTRSALEAMERARDLFAASGNTIQVALAENNLSQIYKAERRFEKAHAAIDRATELFGEVGDRTREGYSLDTKSLVYFEEGKFGEALRTVERAIAILGTSENFAYLTDTIATKARIQLFTNDFSTATLTLLEAVDLAKIRIGEDAAMRLVKEFEETFDRRDALRGSAADFRRTGLASGDLKLVLPPEIANYSDYQGVWINNSDLEPYGLSIGSLAVVVPAPVKRGDLVALLEIATDGVSCGFYDKDFGIVCLEAGGAEPLLFNQSDVRVLGKIIGVCDASENTGGELKVRPL